MTTYGYKLSSEEHDPRRLVELARRAESAGLSFALISDHFHPWIGRQGHSPFVWGALGAIAQATERLEVGTGVTCPTMRMHPAVVAHAAATAACLMPGRFFLGVGTGENLNEHVLGDHWPPTPVRREMLEEAIDVIRVLWRGGSRSHRGRHFTVERAQIFDLPDPLPPIYVAASGPKSVALAARSGDGLIGVAPNPEIVARFDAEGGAGKPRYCEVQVCWARSEGEARRVAHEWWPNSGLPGQLSQEIATPKFFEQAAQLVDEDRVASGVACGPDPERHLEAIRKFEEAGYDHVCLHQIGPEQDGFFDFYERELQPRLG